VVPAILNEVKRVFPGDYVIFNMDGLAFAQSEGANPEPLQMKVPDYANRLASAGAPPSFMDENSLFVAVHDLQGNLKAVMASAFAGPATDDDLRFLISVAELLGHLF
jgi:hypothetical protein